MLNKDVKVPLQEAELVGTSSSNSSCHCFLCCPPPCCSCHCACCCRRHHSPATLVAVAFASFAIANTIAIWLTAAAMAALGKRRWEIVVAAAAMKMAAATAEARTMATATTALMMIACVALVCPICCQHPQGRDMACFDIPGTFLHADSDEDIIIR